MKTCKSLLFVFLCSINFASTSFAQSVGVSNVVITPDASSIFEARATNKGILIPRVLLTATNVAGPITSPLASLLVYNSNTAGVVPNNVWPGYYYWDGAKWVRFATATSAGDAWLTMGNLGTSPGTNWLGTNDAQDFAIRSNNVERARVLSGGNILFNRTTALYGTDLFEAQGNATFPDAINGYTDQPAGNAIFGLNSAANGTAIVGFNSAVTGAGTGFGVYGESAQTGAAGVYGNGTTNTRGVLGITSNVNYAGVQAQNGNANGDAVYAVNTAANGAATGTAIYALSGQSGGATIAGGLQTGIFYVNSAISGVAASAASNGLIGASTNATGTGVVGGGNGVTPTTMGGTGSGGAFAGTGFGTASWATAGTGTGAASAGNNLPITYLVNGSGGAFKGTLDGIFAYNTSLGVSEAIYSNNGGTICRVNYWSGIAQYKILGTGAVSTTVEDVNGDKVIMHCPETPEFYYMDYGFGILENGKVHINIDPRYAKNVIVSEEHPMRVFIQLEGDCNGVFVTNKTGTGFDVVELNGGVSNVGFQYQVVCNAADQTLTNGKVSRNSDLRFEPAPEDKEIISVPSINCTMKRAEKPGFSYERIHK